MTQNSENLSYEDRIAQLRRRFVHTLAERLDDISDVVRAAPETVVEETHAHMIHRMLHDMGGDAAMLEFEGIAQIMLQGVEISERADSAGVNLTEAGRAALDEIIDEARAAATLLREQY